MAHALATVQSVDIDVDGLNMFLYVAFAGPEVYGGAGHVDTVRVRILPADSAIQVRTKMGAAIRGRATELGWTIASGNVNLIFSKD
jgi:hypothetical protein